MRFFHATWNDEIDALPTSFTGSVLGDGVSISTDGTTWYRAYSPSPQPEGVWVEQSIDLSEAAAAAGVPLTQLFIKFQQYDNLPFPSDGRGYDQISITAPTFNEDWYRFSLGDGDAASIVATGLDGPRVETLELFDASGSLLAAQSTAENVDVTIAEWVDVTNNTMADEYFVRVVGEQTDYSLVVTRNVAFDIEPNDSIANAQDVTQLGGALGFVQIPQLHTLDADDRLAESVLDNEFPGVTLSNAITESSVFATPLAFGATTGQQVFGHDARSGGWRKGTNEFRADFDHPIRMVSIDVSSDTGFDEGTLAAYDAQGNLLELVGSSTLSPGVSETLVVDRPIADIASIIATGAGADVVLLDRLVFEEMHDDDYFEIVVGENRTIDIAGTLPGSDPLLFDNGLQGAQGSGLRLELFDPGGQLVANDPAMISHEATMVGAYHLRVFAAEGAGEYFVDVDVSVTVPGDFDANGTWDCHDVDALVAEVAAGGSNSLYDIDENGSVDLSDVHLWLQVAGNQNLGMPYPIGDANLDGVTDGGDFIRWNEFKFSASAGWCQADFNADGFTDGADFITWQSNSSLGAIAMESPETDREEASASTASVASPVTVPPIGPALFAFEWRPTEEEGRRSEGSADRNSREAVIDALFCGWPETRSAWA